MPIAITQQRTSFDSAIDVAHSLRPRVLHLITSFEIGGTERQAVELLKRLDDRRFDIRLAALRKVGTLYQEIATQFPDVPEFPLTSFYNANAVKQLLRLRALIRREGIALLHAHDFYSSLIGATAAHLAGAKIIAAQRHLKLSDRAVHRFGTRLIHRLAHRLLVNSEAVRDCVIQQSPAMADKIALIRNGVLPIAENNLDTARARLCDRLGLPNDAKLIGMVARLQPVKGHRFFLEAAAQVVKSAPGAYFVLAGDGALRDELRAQAFGLGISERVIFLGDVKNVAEILPAFDLVVLASLHEGLPNAVMEAMAAGVAVIATAVGGTRELIADGETGFLIPPANSAALADCVLAALFDASATRAVATRGRRFILKTFGTERMVAEVEHLYESVLTGTV